MDLVTQVYNVKCVLIRRHQEYMRQMRTALANGDYEAAAKAQDLAGAIEDINFDMFDAAPDVWVPDFTDASHRV